jgi:hypothetical protein
MGKIIIKSGQSLFDIALQAYGTIEGVFSLLADNPGKLTTLTDELTPGTELVVNGAVLNKYVADEYTNRGIIPATGLRHEVYGDGIGWWIIENDFIVQ